MRLKAVREHLRDVRRFSANRMTDCCSSGVVHVFFVSAAAWQILLNRKYISLWWLRWMINFLKYLVLVVGKHQVCNHSFSSICCGGKTMFCSWSQDFYQLILLTHTQMSPCKFLQMIVGDFWTGNWNIWRKLFDNAIHMISKIYLFVHASILWTLRRLSDVFQEWKKNRFLYQNCDLAFKCIQVFASPSVQLRSAAHTSYRSSLKTWHDAPSDFKLVLQQL